MGMPEGYYGEVKEGSMIPEGQPISARTAIGVGPRLCGPLRVSFRGTWVTSENTIQRGSSENCSYPTFGGFGVTGSRRTSLWPPSRTARKRSSERFVFSTLHRGALSVAAALLILTPQYGRPDYQQTP